MGAKPCKAAKGEEKAVRPDDPGKKIPPTIARVALLLHGSDYFGRMFKTIRSKAFGLRFVF